MTWFSDLGLETLHGEPLDPAVLDGKVVLFVNVASKCGLTPQYKGLVALHEELAGEPFTVVGVPCNQFGKQEPGTPEEIETFCSTTYGVDFPLLAKQDVNGESRSPLYRHLIGEGPDIKWNFGKFLVGKDGAVIKRFAPTTEPQDTGLKTLIVEAL